MGKNTSKPDLEELISRYNVRCRDDANNLTYLIDRRTSKNYMLKQLFANDEASIKNIQSQLQRKKHLHHDNLAKLKDFYINLSEQFCSRVYSSGALYQIPYRTLQDQRKDRLRTHTIFQQSQLWSILASSILALSYLQGNFIQHQSLRTANIYLQQPSGTLILCDPFTKQLPTNYELFRQQPLASGIYLSPSQLRSYRQQHKYPVHNSYKSDVFVMGVVMLELAFLEVQDGMFKKKGVLDQTELQARIEKVEGKYGEELGRVLRRMMEVGEAGRMDWVQLEGFVRKQEGKSAVKRGKWSAESSRVQDKPATADQNSKKGNQNSSGKVVESTSTILRSPADTIYAGSFRKDENSKVFQQIHPSTSQFQAVIQPQPKPTVVLPSGLAQRPLPRAVRVSQPPLRTTDPIQVWNLQGNRPPTQYQPTHILLHHHQSFQAPPPPPHHHMSRSSNPAFHSQQLSNSSHFAPIQQVFIPTGISGIRGMSPMPMPKTQHSLDTQQFSGRSQEEGYSFIQSLSQESTGQRLQSIPSVRKMQFQTVLHPAQVVAMQQPVKHSSPGKGVQSAHKISVSSTPQERQEKQVANRTQPVTTRNAHVEPMELSKLDAPSSQKTLPHCFYEFRTKQDENFITKPGQLQNKYEKSFLSDQQQNSQKHPPTQSKLPDPTILPSSSTSHKKSLASTKKAPPPPPKDYQSNTPISPPAGAKNNPKIATKPQPQSQQTPAPVKLQFVKQTYKQGSRYEGEKYKGMRHGKGKFFYDDGGMYDGSWNMNRMEGYGKLYYVNGRLAYQGNWVKDHFNGKGKLYNDSPPGHVERFDYRNFQEIEDYWKTYQGEFQNDLKHGKGALILENGQKYQGNFKDDMIHGEGTFKTNDLLLIHGLWQNNHLAKILH